MPLTKDQFDTHAVWKSESETSVAFIKARKDVINDDLDSVDVFGWIEDALADVRSLKYADHWRFPNDGENLDSLEVALNDLRSELEEIIEEPEISKRDDLLSCLDALSSALAGCPLYTVAGEGVLELKKSLQEKDAFLKDAIEWLNTAITESSDDVIGFKERVASLKETIDIQISRTDSLINEQGATFLSKLEEWKGDSDKSAASIVERGQKHLSTLEGLELKSRRLTDASARNTISTEYGLYAVEQEKSAKRWSIGAVCFAVAGFAYLAVAMFTVHNATISETVIKATISSLVVLGAGLMGVESSGHHREARDARRTQLDLNALDPFLELLGQEEANELRRKFAEKIFGRPLANEKTQKPHEWISERLPSKKDKPIVH